jgi:hypothetical protein
LNVPFPRPGSPAGFDADGVFGVTWAVVGRVGGRFDRDSPAVQTGVGNWFSRRGGLFRE